ncbi:MAG: ComEC/Rec2 family competence protein [Candidatus Falkowbacteria bacterium]
MSGKLYKIALISGIVAVLAALFGFWLFAASAGGYLEVDFLDVGQGDAILIKTPAGQNVLIDGGPDIAVTRDLSRNLPWWDRTIDLMILTHPHDDHVNGLNDVLRRYAVKKILYTGVSHDSPGYLNWLRLVREEKASLLIADRPQTVRLGDNCYMEILYPLESVLGRRVENLNNSSIVAKLVYGDTEFLFMGDAESEVEKGLLEKNVDLSADILKAGHHGSDTSSSEEFLAAILPEIAVIQVGENNNFGHPSRRILKRLERIRTQVYRTDLEGTIRLISDGDMIKKDGN